MGFQDIGDIVSRDRRTVSQWVTDWNKRRMASIFTGHQNNQNASKLTHTQKQSLKEALQHAPSAYGLPKSFWDVPTLKTYTQATFGVVYESDQSYHCLLKFSDLSFKYPAAFDYHRDEAKIAMRMDEIHKEIEPFLNNPVWEVFTADEVRLELEAETRRAWLKRGERTVVKVNRKREAQSCIGFLNQKSFICHLYDMPWQNQEEVLNAFKVFLTTYPDKNICVIWDNASFHKGKDIRAALRGGELLERVHLIALPPYAPDMNPIEHVWNDSKSAIGNRQYDTFKETREAFRHHIARRTFKYRV